MIDPGAGSQIVDIQPGIQPNGLFWTTRIGRRDYRSSHSVRQLRLKELPLTDSHQFAGTDVVPATASTNLKWKATSGPMARGLGTTVDPTDPGAFEADFADALCTGWVTGERLGFAFESTDLTSAGYYASFGDHANGAWLA